MIVTDIWNHPACNGLYGYKRASGLGAWRSLKQFFNFYTFLFIFIRSLSVFQVPSIILDNPVRNPEYPLNILCNPQGRGVTTRMVCPFSLNSLKTPHNRSPLVLLSTSPCGVRQPDITAGLLAQVPWQ